MVPWTGPMWSALAAFLAVSLLVIVTPGQDTALTVRNTLAGGRRGGFCTAAGVATGQVVWATATAVGLAGILLASQPAFLVVKIAGAVYLGWLGVQALRDALRRTQSERRAVGRPISPFGAYRQGVLSDLGNPKVAAFFVSLLPQVVPRGEASLGVLLTLGLAFCLLTLAWLTIYALAVARMETVLRRPLVRRALDGAVGCVFFGLGIRLATAQR